MTVSDNMRQAARNYSLGHAMSRQSSRLQRAAGSTSDELHELLCVGAKPSFRCPAEKELKWTDDEGRRGVDAELGGATFLNPEADATCGSVPY